MQAQDYDCLMIALEAKMTDIIKSKAQGGRAYLREAILSGKFKPGSYMPSVRSVSEKLNISKSTVHNIFRLLQEEGLVQLYPGRGVLVTGIPEGSPTLKRFFLKTSDFGTFNYLPVASQLLLGACAGAEKKNSEYIMNFSDSDTVTDEIITLYTRGDIQGVIYLQCSNYADLIKPLEKAGIPCVIASDMNGLNAAKVFLDFREVARNAVRYLKSKGHRRIGIWIGSQDNYFYKEFFTGFKGALAEEDLEFNKKWCLSDIYQEDSLKSDDYLNKVKNDMPGAIFTVRDYRAKLLYNSCRKQNIKIPDDLSVISYDGITWAEAELNGLSYFTEPAHEQGEAAVEMLQKWILNGEKPESINVHSTLVERTSVKQY